MTNFFLRINPVNPQKGRLEGGGLNLACAIGKAGIITRKREGDGGTPRTTLKPLRIYFRRDQWPMRHFALPFRSIKTNDGWCDDVSSPRYNRLISLPFNGTCETLWRADHLYDLVIETDWNTKPAIRGRGSAIFIHLARPGLTPTEGCLALSRKDMKLFLSRLTRKTKIVIP